MEKSKEKKPVVLIREKEETWGNVHFCSITSQYKYQFFH